MEKSSISSGDLPNNGKDDQDSNQYQASRNQLFFQFAIHHYTFLSELECSTIEASLTRNHQTFFVRSIKIKFAGVQICAPYNFTRITHSSL